MDEPSRRELLGSIATVAAVASVAGVCPIAAQTAHDATIATGRPAGEPFGYCLNTSTLRGHQLDIVAEIALAAKVGYQAIEPWTMELDAYVQAGGALKDLGQRIRDPGSRWRT